MYFNEDTRKFQRDPPEDFEDPVRTFVAFILEPMYKLIGHTLGEEREELAKVLEEVGVNLPRGDYNLTTRNMLKSVGRHFFQGSYAFVDAVVEHVNNPSENAAEKTRRIYTGRRRGRGGSRTCVIDQFRIVHQTGSMWSSYLFRRNSTIVCHEQFFVDFTSSSTINPLPFKWKGF